MQQMYKDGLYHSFNIEPIKVIKNNSKTSACAYVEVKKANEGLVKGN
jgi:hypothetical protein